MNGNAVGLSRIGSGGDAVSQESGIGPWRDSVASIDASSGEGGGRGGNCGTSLFI